MTAAARARGCPGGGDGRAQGEMVLEGGIRPRGDDAHGVLVDDVDGADQAEVQGLARLQLGIADAVEAELHRFRIDLLAVVELDALADLELPGRGVQELPRLGQPGDELEVLVAERQRVVDVQEGVVGGRVLVPLRIGGGGMVGSTPWAMTILPAGASEAAARASGMPGPNGSRTSRATRTSAARSRVMVVSLREVRGLPACRHSREEARRRQRDPWRRCRIAE